MTTAAPEPRDRRGRWVIAGLVAVAVVSGVSWWSLGRAGDESSRDDTTAALRVAMEELLAGPTPAERRAGLDSWFSEETADRLRSVTIEGGHAVVDFHDLRDVIPNAGSSAGSRRLLAELDATVFQFRSISSVEYRLDGDCEAFTEWLQIGGCDPRPRPARRS